MKRKWIAGMLAALLVAGSLTGCGKSQGADDASQSAASEGSSAAGVQTGESTAAQNDGEQGAAEQSYAGTTLTMFMNAMDAELDAYKDILADFEAETGIHVEPTILPGENEDYGQKLSIALMSEDTTDIVQLSNANVQNEFATAGFLESLNTVSEKAGIDFDDYGKYLTKYGEDVYYLPITVSLDVVFYNKQIFDDAGVAYPEAPWSWEDYVEAAKAVTNTEKGIYGSFMEQYDYMGIIQANLKEVPAYKEDGSCNFDDPAFAESLQWFADLGNVHKIQPSWLEMTTKKIAWDAFMTGNYGMIYVGSWHMSLMNDSNYPHDWEWGIAAPPADDDAKNMLGDGGAIAINKNSKNKEAAAVFVDYYAKNWYKYRNELPGNEAMEEEELLSYLGTLSEGFGGVVAAEDLYKAYYDNGLGFQPEHISGTASSEYNSIILKEAELYYIGQQSLEDTVSNIKEQVDTAIENASN